MNFPLRFILALLGMTFCALGGSLMPAVVMKALFASLLALAGWGLIMFAGFKK